MDYAVLWSLSLTCVLCSATISKEEIIKKEICMAEHFKPDCQQGQVVVIESAHFGRMQHGRCITSYENLKCSADVTHYVESLCAGRKSCDLFVPTRPLLDSSHGCSTDRMMYLEVSYKCRQVYTTSDDCHNGLPLNVNGSVGYLASSITRETNKGSPQCPWKIQVEPGQSVALGLVDYGSSEESANSSLHATQEAKCYIYAKITEGLSPAHSVLKCGSEERIRRVYSSTSNSIQIALVHVSNVNFLLKFEVEGCADISVPPGGKVERSGGKVQVQCSTEDEAWQATCTDGQWLPHKNCSAVAVASQVGPSNQSDVSNGTVVLLVAGVALFISLAIITFGIIFLRCRSKSTLAGQAVRPLNSHKYSVPVYYDGSKELYPMLANQERMSVDWDRDYTTTLQMRRSLPSTPRHRLVSEQDVWSCPVHGHVGSPFSTIDRRRLNSTNDPTYEIPHLNPNVLIDLQANSTAFPFYHELDPRALQQMNAIREAEAAAAAAAASAEAASAAAAADAAVPSETEGPSTTVARTPSRKTPAASAARDASKVISPAAAVKSKSATTEAAPRTSTVETARSAVKHYPVSTAAAAPPNTTEKAAAATDSAAVAAVSSAPHTTASEAAEAAGLQSTEAAALPSTAVQSETKLCDDTKSSGVRLDLVDLIFVDSQCSKTPSTDASEPLLASSTSDNNNTISTATVKSDLILI